ADVFVCNLLPRRQVKYGLDSQSLLTLNPRLVHATLTGYGVTGPDVERAGYDITAYFGRGGIVHTMTEPESWAPRLRPAMGTTPPRWHCCPRCWRPCGSSSAPALARSST